MLAELPHDRSAFTQGLELDGGTLYEGTGLAGRSELRELDPATGAVRRAVPLPDDLFGEGITVVGDRIWQLTWRDGVALEWDRATLRLLRQVPMDGEGWGLCRDGDRLVRSDGTARLRFHDPVTFAETGAVDVTLDGRPVTGPQRAGVRRRSGVGERLAVRPHRPDRPGRQARSPPSSTPQGSSIRQQRSGTDVLNGIAAVGGGEYLLTGKLWPATFRVRFVA